MKFVEEVEVAKGIISCFSELLSDVGDVSFGQSRLVIHGPIEDERARFSQQGLQMGIRPSCEPV